MDLITQPLPLMGHRGLVDENQDQCETPCETPCEIPSPVDSENSTSTDMAPPGRARPSTPRREADLSGFLSFAERVDLVCLSAKITDAMQNHITLAFDSAESESAYTTARPRFWSQLPSHLGDLELMSARSSGRNRMKANNSPVGKENGYLADKENVPISNRAPSLETSNSELSATLCNEPQAQERENSEPRSQELKKETLANFKKWQLSLQKRIGDVSAKKPVDAHHGRRSSSSANSNRSSSSSRYQAGAKPSKESCPVADIDTTITRLYPPTNTTLNLLTWEKKCLLLHSMLLLVLSLEHYSAFSRVFMLNLTSSLGLPRRALEEDEMCVAGGFAHFAKQVPTDEETQKKLEENKSSKKWKQSLATVAAYTAADLVGGLAAPLATAGVGEVSGIGSLGNSVVAGLLGSMADNMISVGSLFGVYGARATGKMMDQYAKDVQDFAFRPLRGSLGEMETEIGKVKPENRGLRVVIGIGGWQMDREDCMQPWRIFGHQNESYVLRWEKDSLTKLGGALQTIVRSVAWTLARKEMGAGMLGPFRMPLSNSPLSNSANLRSGHPPSVIDSLRHSLWPAGLLRISKIVDNPWNVGMVRADKAGATLADIIMNKVQGERGVTLIGYSLGARVIYACLMILAERRAFGLVENAVLMGTPAPSDAQAWCAMRSAVCGRLVNVFSENDCILGFLYRTGSIQHGLAGLQPITEIDGVENVDVSDKISNHLRYRFLVGSILIHIGWEDMDKAEVHQNEQTLNLTEEKERERQRKRDAVELSLQVAEPASTNRNTQSSHGIVQTRFRKTKGKKR